MLEGVGLAHGQPKGEGNAMKCGRGHEHVSVQEVRACYGQPQEVSTIPARTADGRRTNKFAGDCFRCQVRVAPGKGFIFRSPGAGSQRLGQGEWLVSHLNGECVTPEEAADLAAIKTMQPRQAARPNFKAIPQGYYATKCRTGNNDLDFWFVRVPETGKWQGWRFVRRIIGGRGPQVIPTAEGLAALHAILEAGVDNAGNLYADTLGNCKKCGRDLTDDESRARRLGPVCAGK